MRSRTLGTRIAVSVGLSTAASILVFAAVAALVVSIEIRSGGGVPEPGETPFYELVEHVAFATAVAAPLAIGLAVATARWAVRRATARVDDLISAAARIDVHNISSRLPESRDDDEIERLTRTLNSFLERIDRGVAAHRQFAADASHELRTPLAVIINSIEVARRRPRDSAEWERVVDRTLVDARRMVALVEALLQATRGADAERREAILIEDALRPIVDRWRASGRGVRLDLEIDDGLSLRADPRALTIAIENLVANAVAHSPPEGRVSVRARKGDACVYIEVEDDGPGVPKEERQRIFEAFARGAHAADRDGAKSGMGLGLSIAKRIVEASGGRIFVGEKSPRGARFVAEFPPDAPRLGGG